MNKKEELKKLLKEFSKEELMEIFNTPEEDTPFHEIDKNRKKKTPRKRHEVAKKATKTIPEHKIHQDAWQR